MINLFITFCSFWCRTRSYKGGRKYPYNADIPGSDREKCHASSCRCLRWWCSFTEWEAWPFQLHEWDENDGCLFRWTTPNVCRRRCGKSDKVVISSSGCIELGIYTSWGSNSDNFGLNSLIANLSNLNAVKPLYTLPVYCTIKLVYSLRNVTNKSAVFNCV